MNVQLNTIGTTGTNDEFVVKQSNGLFRYFLGKDGVIDNGCYGYFYPEIGTILLNPKISEDLDGVGICDSTDYCIGIYDECGICNGEGQLACWDGVYVCDLNDCLDQPTNYPDWSFNIYDFEFNGSITSKVLLNDIDVVSPGELLGAFINDELRGLSMPLGPIPFGPNEGTYAFALLIYSNDTYEENITFKFER